MTPRALSILAAAALLSPSTLAAQGADLLVLLRGADTIAVERFTRTAASLEGELLFKAAGARFTYTVRLDGNGRVTEMENAFRQATADPSSAPAQQATITFANDSAHVAVVGGSTQRFAVSGDALPYINPSFALVELATTRAAAAGGRSLTVPMFALAGGQTFPMAVTREGVGADSVAVLIGSVEARLAVSRDGTVLGGIIPAQGLVIHRTRARDGGAAALRMDAPDYSAPAGAHYSAVPVTVSTPAGHALAGTLTLPRRADGPVAAVVTISGSGGQERDHTLAGITGYAPWRELAVALARAGIAVLRMDDRGVGESGGVLREATSRDLADDIRAGVAYLRSRPDIDGARIGLVGLSEGGLIGPMLAADDPALRALVVMAGPSQTGRTIIEHQTRNGLSRMPSLTSAARDSLFRANMDSVAAQATRTRWLAYFLDYDPLPTARRVKTPTLILHGATDQQVTPDQAEDLAGAMRAGGNARVEVHVFPETNHLFLTDPDGFPGGYATLPSKQVRPDVLRTMVDWLGRTLR